MKALVVAGGLPQITLIKELRERGIQTVLIDGSSTPIARDYADIFYQINIFDIEAVIEIARAEKVDFAITVCADQVLIVVAQVAEALGFPWYIDYNTARMVSDKELMKKVFVENGIPTSRFIIMEELNIEMTSLLHYPLIVKPVDSYSSKGVRKVFSIDELKIAYTEAKSISRSKKIIVEEFFEGKEISVDLFVEEGKAHVLLISGSEKIKDKDHFVIFRGRYPIQISNTLKVEIEEVAQRIVDAFHIYNAPMLIQMLYDGKEISVLEFCARTGGAMKWLLIQRATGVDVIKGVIDLVLGIRPNIEIKEPKNKYIINDFIYCYSGVFDHLDGFNEQLQANNIADYRVLRPKGWKCSGQIGSSSDRVCGVTFQADTLEELNIKHREFVNSVKVLDTHGCDIMRHDLLPDVME